MLARILSGYKSELICDMAQYYHIYNLVDYRIGYIATLACGLPPESRTQMALHGQTLNPLMTFLATIIDQNNLLLWQNGGGKGAKPESVMETLKKAKEKEAVPKFSKGTDFLAYRNKYMKGNTDNG